MGVKFTWMQRIEDLTVDFLALSEIEEFFDFGEDEKESDEIERIHDISCAVKQAIIDHIITHCGQEPSIAIVRATRLPLSIIRKALEPYARERKIDPIDRECTINQVYFELRDTIARILAPKLLEERNQEMVTDITTAAHQIKRQKIQDEQAMADNEKMHSFLREIMAMSADITRQKIDQPLNDQGLTETLSSLIHDEFLRTHFLECVRVPKEKKPILALGVMPDALETLVQPEIILSNPEMGIRLLITSVSPRGIRAYVLHAEDYPWLEHVHKGNTIDFVPTRIPNMWQSKNMSICLSLIADHETKAISILPARGMFGSRQVIETQAS